MNATAAARGRRRARRTAGLGTPAVLVPPAVLALLFLVLPTVALVVRTPWTQLGRIYSQGGVWTALRLSIYSSLLATAIAVIIGVPLAWVLARLRFPGIAIARAFVTIPLVLPPVIGGVALFQAFGRLGMLGDAIRAVLGEDLPFTFAAVVVAQVFVAMPFLVITVEGAFRLADRRIEEAAATLGASRLRIFTHVTLPLVLPALVAGTVLCWARALGEFGATLLFGGNTPGVTRTLPTDVLTVFANDPADAPALSLPLIAAAVLILGTLRERWLRPATVA